MNYFFLLFVVAIIVSSAFIAFREQIRDGALNTILRFTTGENAPAAPAETPSNDKPFDTSSSSEAKPLWIPPGFVGPPPGEPSIIGPSGPPPNY